MASKTVRVWEVIYHSDEERLAHAGAAGDGSFIERFAGKRGEADAQAFAAGRTYYGKPAEVDVVDAPKRLAARWGF